MKVKRYSRLDGMWKTAKIRSRRKAGTKDLFATVGDEESGKPHITSNGDGFKVRVLFAFTVPVKGDDASCCDCILDEKDVIQHLRTTEHFRWWCLEHPAQVPERFPWAVRVMTEEVLTGGGR